MIPSDSALLTCSKIEVPKILGKLEMPRPGVGDDRKFVNSRHLGLDADHDYGSAKDREDAKAFESPKRKRQKKDSSKSKAKDVERASKKLAVAVDDEDEPLGSPTPLASEKSKGAPKATVSSSSTSSSPVSSITGSAPSVTSAASSCSSSSPVSSSSSSSSVPALPPAAVDFAQAVEAALRPLYKKVQDLEDDLKTARQENVSFSDKATQLQSAVKSDWTNWHNRIGKLETWAENLVFFFLTLVFISFWYCFFKFVLRIQMTRRTRSPLHVRTWLPGHHLVNRRKGLFERSL